MLTPYLVQWESVVPAGCVEDAAVIAIQRMNNAPGSSGVLKVAMPDGAMCIVNVERIDEERKP